MHGLICVDREGTACTKVVLQSRVRFRHWWLTLGFLGVSVVDVFAVLFPLLFGLWSCSHPCWGFSVFVLPVVVVAVPCGPRGLVGVLLLALSLVPGPPGEGCGFGLSRLRVLRSWYFVFGVHVFVFLPISTWLRIFAVFAAFSELRSARQVERFAECSLRHLPPVVFHLAGTFGVSWCSS